VSEPPLIADWPRYSARAFPSYSFLPGKTPHPRRNPLGHSFGLPEPFPLHFNQNDWQASDDYLYAVDLYNFAYWWESHELFEGFWKTFGRATQEGIFFQALIQLAAANIKRVLGNEAAVKNLTHSGLKRLEKIPRHYMGVDIASFAECFKVWLKVQSQPYVLIRLDP